MQRELATHREDLPHTFHQPSTIAAAAQAAAAQGRILCELCGKDETDGLHKAQRPAEQARERAHYTMLETEKGS